MSRNAMERLLHRLCVDRREKQRFKDDFQGLIKRFQLSEEEIEMLREMDVQAMQLHGVNPMLTLGFWFENANDPTPKAYIDALVNGVAAQGESRE
ncbi:MAG: extradiol ring-cleavage dioxygenase [Pusillimonas sp.]|jgi:protocatechuate 4,5-dioxygenase alpha chain|nr:extradiol ring-cleavage dioxygenase [Pusillimonas sp.]|tara:strand:+ start:378 stop:662 length:285 start_codon:yes stop_codon:yes gene_type:complete